MVLPLLWQAPPCFPVWCLCSAVCLCPIPALPISVLHHLSILPLLRWRLSSLKAALKLCFFQHSPNCSYKEFEMWTNKRNCSWVMELIKTGFLQIRIISLLDALFSAQTGLLFSVSVLCPSLDTHSSLRLSLILSHISGLCGAPDVTAGWVLGICRRAVWMCVCWHPLCFGARETSAFSSAGRFAQSISSLLVGCFSWHF